MTARISETSMTIEEFFNWMDGNGIIVTDIYLVEETLKEYGYKLEDNLELYVEGY